ncbi:hypothetical protein ABZX77_49860 [Streptomyces sp. NPDC004237]|uniref:hypothetical protein n=1 Tax=Streptomyces sp. NPDC004237 TaxID=3154455 RepID=UPI0033B15011
MTGMSAVGRRGRHRKPRPRKVMLAAGGLALAAGVLSLVRMTPDGGGVGGPGAAEAEPRLDPTAHATDRPVNTAATLGAAPTAPPSATTLMDSERPTPTAAPRTAPSPTASPTALPGATTVPTTIPTGPTGPARPTSPPPAPATTPATTPAPAPAPSTQQPGDGVCLPIVGLCVNPLPRSGRG